jgi:hypothetical protein
LRAGGEFADDAAVFSVLKITPAVDIEERFVSAVLGAFWGAFLGFLLVMVMNYQVNTAYTSAALFANWKSVIPYSSAFFAALGLVFKASAASLIGGVMDWLWVLVTGDKERGLLSQHHTWIKLLAIGIFCLAVYWFVKD